METSQVQTIKLAIVHAVGLSKDALHIYFGLAVFLTSVLLTRRSGRTWLPVVAVIAVAALGEALDARDDLALLGHWRVGDSVHDILNTAFWPVILTGLLRFRLLSSRQGTPKA